MAHVTRDFSAAQSKAVKRVNSLDDIAKACPANFIGTSPCFAAVAFTQIPLVGDRTNSSIVYTLVADSAARYIDVVGHKGSAETKMLPLQWAIDKVTFLHY